MNPVIRQILDNINVLSRELERPGTQAPSRSAVEGEVTRSFRGTSTSTSTHVNASSAPRFTVSHNFTQRRGRRQSERRRGAQNTGFFVKDVILLCGPEDDQVPRQGSRVWLMENNHVVSGAEFRKEWNASQLQTFLKGLFPSKFDEDDEVEVVMPVHSKLVPPHLAPSQQLSGYILQKIFKDKPIYIRPPRQLLEPMQRKKKRIEVRFED